MNKLIGDVIATAKLRDGTEVEIRFDKCHYRAYNIEEQQVGPPRVVLDGLLTEIGGTLLHVPPANTGQPELPAETPGDQSAVPGPEAQGWQLGAEAPNLRPAVPPEPDEQGEERAYIKKKA